MSSNTNSIQIKQVVLEVSSKKAYRMLWVSPDRSFGYWIDPDGKSNIPDKFNPEELATCLVSGVFEYIKDTWTPCIPEDDIPFKWK